MGNRSRIGLALCEVLLMIDLLLFVIGLAVLAAVAFVFNKLTLL